MIYQASEIVRNYIETSGLSFIDKLGGLVKTYEKQDGQGNILRFPIAYNLTESECSKGKYLDFTPDGTHKSAIYFEGDRFSITRNSSKALFSGEVKLVCWMNLQKLGYETPFSHIAIAKILQSLPSQPFSFTPDGFNNPQYQRVIIQARGTEFENLFSKYTYAKKVNFFPYDSFAINLNVSFEVNYSCIEVPEPGGESCS
jgi:hypothetical protein